MPFNGSGDFSRVHNWQQDRDNGIKILALRMDQEFDNFQGGMNLTFLRNGLVPMTANLNLGTNYIIGLGSGSVGALPIRFADDPNTGLFLNGYNKLGLVSNGVMCLEANTTGVAMTGNMTNSGTFNNIGAITQNGQQVWHAGNLVNPVTTAGATFVGGVSAPLFQIDPNYTMNIFGVGPLMVYDANDYQFYDRTSNVHGFAVAGVDRFTVNSAGAAVTGTLSATGAITQNGQQVWHAGNFNPANYAALANNNVYTGNFQQYIAPTPYLQFTPSGWAGQSSYLESGVAANSSGLGSYMNFNIPLGRRFGVVVGGSGNVLDVGGTGAAVTGTLSATGAITQAGNQVWHAGNFTPSSYAALTGATFTGPVGFNIANFNATNDGAGNPIFNMDAGADFFGYNRAGNFYDFLVAGNSRLQVSATGASTNGTFNATGAITQAGNQVWHAGNFNPSSYATLANPALTGTPTAPTAATSTNTTQIATTAFVQAQLAATAMPLSGGAFTGNITRSGAGAYLNRGAAGLSATVTQGTAAPSGGSDGDIYLQYT